MVWAELQDQGSSHYSSVYSFYSQNSKKNFKFSLQIDPRGEEDKEKDDDDIGVYLMNNNSEKIGVSASFSVANKGKLREFSSAIEANSGHGYSNFLTRAELAENKTTYLPEGHLHIHCQFALFIYEKKMTSKAETLESLKDSMQRLLIDASLYDTTIICGEEKLPCHGSILANR